MNRTIQNGGCRKYRAVAEVLRDIQPDPFDRGRVAWFNLVCLLAEVLKPRADPRSRAERAQFKAIATGKLHL